MELEEPASPMQSNLTPPVLNPLRLESKFDDEQYQLMKVLHLELLIKTLKENEEMKKDNAELKKRIKSLGEIICNSGGSYWFCDFCEEVYTSDYISISCDCTYSCVKCASLNNFVPKKCDTCDNKVCNRCIQKCDICHKQCCHDCILGCDSDKCTVEFCPNCEKDHNHD